MEADEKHQDVTTTRKKTFPIFHLEQGDVCGLRANPCSGDRSLKSVGCDFSYAEVDIMALFTK